MSMKLTDNFLLTFELEPPADRFSLQIDDLVYHERGYIGIVTNKDYCPYPEVEVKWLGSADGQLSPRTSLVFLRKVNID